MCLGPEPIGCRESPELFQARVLRIVTTEPESILGSAKHEWRKSPKGAAHLVCKCGRELAIWRVLEAAEKGSVWDVLDCPRTEVMEDE